METSSAVESPASGMRPPFGAARLILIALSLCLLRRDRDSRRAQSHAPHMSSSSHILETDRNDHGCVNRTEW